jgi:hypothetical protein
VSKESPFSKILYIFLFFATPAICPASIFLIHQNKLHIMELILFSNTNLDFVIISSRHKERLLIMEADSTNWTIMFIKLVQECAHSVVPQLNHSIV